MEEGADDEEAAPAAVVGVLDVLRALVLAADGRVGDDGDEVEDDEGDADADEEELAELLDEASEEVDGVGEELHGDEGAGEDDADDLEADGGQEGSVELVRDVDRAHAGGGKRGEDEDDGEEEECVDDTLEVHLELRCNAVLCFLF